MAIELYKKKFNQLSNERLKKWQAIPTSVIGDSLNRQHVMSSRIKPLHNTKIVGQAQTVTVVAGDNGPVHAAMSIIEPSHVLVIDGNGYKERALWGSILNKLAIRLKVGGVIIDGAVRDIDELREMNLPLYFESVTPAGPHKGWGGSIGKNISCGGVSVSLGDIIIGDADGVVVVPLENEEKVFKDASERLLKEQEIISKIELGSDLKGIFEYPAIEHMDC